MSRISVGGIFGFIKSKFRPTLKPGDFFDPVWRHKETGVIVHVTKYHIAVGPDVHGRFIRFVDPNFPKNTQSMTEQDFRKEYVSLGKMKS